MSRYATGRNCAGSLASSRARLIVLSSTWSSSRKRSTRPLTVTRSPRWNWPARKSASRNARAGIAPVRSRNSTARYGDPFLAVRRSLRVQANTPSTSPPALSSAMVIASIVIARSDVGYREVDERCDLAGAPRAACTGDGVRLQGLERRGRGGHRGALLHSRLVRGARDRRDRPGGLLRLHGRAPQREAHRGQPARDRVAGELVLGGAGSRRGGRPRDAPGGGAVAALA